MTSSTSFHKDAGNMFCVRRGEEVVLRRRRREVVLRRRGEEVVLRRRGKEVLSEKGGLFPQPPSIETQGT